MHEPAQADALDNLTMSSVAPPNQNCEALQPIRYGSTRESVVHFRRQLQRHVMWNPSAKAPISEQIACGFYGEMPHP